MDGVRALRPLRLAGWGMLLVFLDFEFNGLDLIPDPIGWVMAASATSSLAAHSVAGSRMFGFASVAAVAALLTSLPEWVGVTDAAIIGLGAIVNTSFVFATCTAIMVAAPPQRVAANVIRWLDLALTAAFVVGMPMADGPQEVTADARALVVLVVGLAVFVWFIVLLFRTAKLYGEPLPGASPIG